MNRDRAIRLGVLYAGARTGHKLGDYGAQTDHQACRKAAPGYNLADDTPYRQTWAANQRHVAAYHAALCATVAAVCAVTGVRVRPGRAMAALAVSWASHSLIDRRWPVERFMRATGSGGWYDTDPGAASHVDQMLHDVCLLAAVGIASG